MGRRGEREAVVQTGGVQGLAWVLGIRKLKQQPKLPPPPPKPLGKAFLEPIPTLEKLLEVVPSLRY